MMRFRYRTIQLIAVFILLAATAESCGPEFAGLVFTREHGPDAPISAFTKGKIGIPLPRWWRPYLVVAYRYLEGKPLSGDEARSFAEFWGTEEKFGFPSDPANKALEKWVKARAQYEPANPQDVLKAYKETGFNAQLNCTASAFNTAVETLRARAQHFGVESPELREWIAGQDAVFKNCDSDDKNPVRPNELPATADPLLRADRSYQIAAAHFYIGNYSEAEAGFDAISHDETSPWQPIAPYLAARAVIRQISNNLSGFAEPDRLAKDVPLVKDAEKRLKAVIDDPRREHWYHDARKLLNLIAFRTEPLQYQHRLAKEIVEGGAGEDFGQDVRDYTLLLDKYLDAEPDFPSIDHYGDKYNEKLGQWRREQYEALWHERSDELTDWIMTFQSDSKAASMHAISKWRASGTTPWLFLAAAKLAGRDPASEGAIRATAKIEPESPAFVAFAYHRARLLRERGDLESARKVLNEALSAKEPLSLSAKNLLTDEKIKLAENLKDFTSMLARRPVKLSYDWDDESETGCFASECNSTFYGAKSPNRKSQLLEQFDPTTALLLNNRTPTEILVKIVNEKTLPHHLQQRIAPSVWARAALLNQPDLATSVAEAAAEARPELKPFIQEFAMAKNQEERRFVAAYAISHFPGLRPFVDSIYPRETEFTKVDTFRDNWWCADVGGVQDHVNYEKQWNKDLKPEDMTLTAAFITTEKAQVADREWKTLLAIGSSYQYLPKVIIDWAKTHPNDPRVPEALHFSSGVSRYGCSQVSDKNNFSHEAFTLLHKNYPQSEWTQKTKYWF
jgi:hypothetical protein